MDFDKEFEKGPATYEQSVGEWWQSRTTTKAHKEAYKQIAQFTKKSAPNAKVIIDYACGTGDVLYQITSLFSDAHFLGLDASEVLLDKAKSKLPKNAHLIKTMLPNFSLPKKHADVVLFTFPNIVPHPDEQPYYDDHGYEDETDEEVAQYLANAREPDPEDETVTDDQETLKDVLLTNKVIARNLHSLLKKGGYCIRVEYANAPRDELTPLVEARTAFEEGSLEQVHDLNPIQLFKKISSVFFSSNVIEDVYHQTQDETDKEGGYFITLLQAL